MRNVCVGYKGHWQAGSWAPRNDLWPGRGKLVRIRAIRGKEFSSSVCVYRDMQPGEPPLTEDDAIPAEPDNEYGWEKLYAERVALAYGRRPPCPPKFGGLGAVRIARFENCYGPEGTWTGGREKAPAAICRKVAQAENGGIIEVWGDGTAVRVFTYVDDLVDGIYMLMLLKPTCGSTFNTVDGCEVCDERTYTNTHAQPCASVWSMLWLIGTTVSGARASLSRCLRVGSSSTAQGRYRGQLRWKTFWSNNTHATHVLYASCSRWAILMII